MSIPSSLTPLFNSGSSAGAGGLQIERSIRLNSADSAYFSRTPAVAGTRTTWTWAGWFKKASNANQYFGLFSAGGSSYYDSFAIGGNNADTLYISFANSAGTNNDYFPAIETTQVFRDLSAWYHVVIAVDTTQAVSSDRIKLYVNGSQVTTFGATNYPAQNYQANFFNNTTTQYLGSAGGGPYGGRFFNGYLTNIHFIDGQALTPSSFTETDATTGQLIPKTYTGSYGTNGFNLLFADNSSNTASTLGKDTGNSNNWTPNNLSVTAGAGNDSLVDSPTNYGTDTGVGGEVRGNYCTLNPLAKGSTQTLSNGNLDVTGSGSHGTTNSTIAVTAGSKTYIEFTRTGTAGGGWGFTSNPTPYSGFPDAVSSMWYVYDNDGGFSYFNNGTQVEYGTKTTTGQILQLAIDYDAGKAWIGINNTWFTTANATTGNPGAGTNPTFTFTTSLPLFPLVEAAGWIVSCNYGARAFAYTAPSGFKALCTQNLPATLVTKSNTAFDVALWTGNGSTQTISNLAFSPDWVWIKNRTDSVAADNRLFDTARGATIEMYSNFAEKEAAFANGLTSFLSNGFSVGSHNSVNGNSDAIVAWCWDAGTSPASNNSGSIISTVRANVTAGFSVVIYTGNNTSGATFGHGLGVTPQFFIVKNRSIDGPGWVTYHASLGSTKYLTLNETIAQQTYSGVWNNTAPTSTVITLGNDNGVNAGNNYVAYCFAPVIGYSSFGSYVGNGSATKDGPFIYTGFRPRWIMIKNITFASDYTSWLIQDTARSPYNVMPDTNILWANKSVGEGFRGNGILASSYNKIDAVSNGFKIREESTHELNDASATYIYIAFAESPFQYARAR